MLNNLGNAYGQLGREADIRKQIEYQEEALRIEEKIYGKIHYNVAATLCNLGDGYRALGKQEDLIMSMKLQLRALKIKEKVLGKYHPGIAKTLDNLGQVYEELGGEENIRKKITLQLRALKIQEKAFGMNHPYVARTLNNIGIAYDSLGGEINIREQIVLQERALRIQEIVLGRDHHEIAKTLCSLGSAYENLGGEVNIIQSIEYRKRALRITESQMDSNHYGLAKILGALGISYGKLGGLENLRTQIELQEKAIKLYGNVENADVARIFSNLGNAYCKYGGEVNIRKSIEYQEKALKIFRRSFSNNHLTVARTLDYQGCAYAMLGGLENLRTQIRLQEEAVKIFEKEGPLHPDRAIALYNLGQAYKKLGGLENLRTQIRLQEEALSILKRTGNDNHPCMIRAVSSTVESCYMFGGVEFGERAVKILRTSFGENDLEVGVSLGKLGHTYFKLGDYKKAIELQIEALKIFNINKDNANIEQAHKGLRRAINEFARCFNLNEEICIRILKICEDKGINFADFYVQQRLVHLFFSEGILELAKESLNIAKVFADQDESCDIRIKRGIYHNLGRVYNVLALQLRNRDRLEESERNVGNARETFKKALSYSTSTENNAGLYVEYANFLLAYHKYREAFAYLQQAIDSHDYESKLGYSAVEKYTIGPFLQRVIDAADNKSIEVIALHYAYYLLILHYDRFIEEHITDLKEKGHYIKSFYEVVSENSEKSSLSLESLYTACAMSAHILLGLSGTETSVNSKEDASSNSELEGILLGSSSLEGQTRGSAKNTAKILGFSWFKGEMPPIEDGYKIVIIDSAEKKLQYPSGIDVVYQDIQEDTKSCADNAFIIAVKARSIGLKVFLYEQENHLVAGVHCLLNQAHKALLQQIDGAKVLYDHTLETRYREAMQVPVLYLGNTDEAIYQSFSRLSHNINNQSIDPGAIVSETKRIIDKIASREDSEQFEEMLGLLLDIQNNAQKHKVEHDSLITSYEETNSFISEGMKVLSNLVSSSSSIVQSYISDLIERLRDIIPKTILEETQIIQAIEHLIEFQGSYIPILPIGRPPHGPNNDPDDWGGNGGDNPYGLNDAAVLLSGNMTNNYNSTSIDWGSNTH
jgi:tetratricopeptide (TPR) repeat protein